MAWKFRKRFSTLGGLLRFNISKSGVSTTIGIKGASVNIGKNGAYINTGIPSTGIYDRQRIGRSKANSTKRETPNANSDLERFKGNSWFNNEEYETITKPSRNIIDFYQEILFDADVKKVLENSSIDIFENGKRLTKTSDILRQLMINDATYCCKEIYSSVSVLQKGVFGLLWLYAKFYDGLDSPMCEKDTLDYSVFKLSKPLDEMISSFNHSQMSFPHIFIVAELLHLADKSYLLLRYLKYMDSFINAVVSFQGSNDKATDLKKRVQIIIKKYDTL